MPSKVAKNTRFIKVYMGLYWILWVSKVLCSIITIVTVVTIVNGVYEPNITGSCQRYYYD